MSNDNKPAAAQEAVAQPEPYIVGNQYRTQSGTLVRFVAVHNEGTSYESMEDEDGVNRYTRRDFGRVTGTCHEYSDPRNTPPLYAAPVAAAPADSAVLTNPYTGQPRDYRDVESDPAGTLIVNPKEPLFANNSSKKAWWAGYRAGKGLPPDTPRSVAASTPAAPGIDVAPFHALHASLVEQANDAEINALEADSIGLNDAAKRSDAAEKVLRRVADELAALLIDASPKGGSDIPQYTTGHCESHKKPGGCPMHNLQCGYPKCDRRQATSAEVGS